MQVVVSDGTRSYKAAVDAHLAASTHVLEGSAWSAGSPPGSPWRAVTLGAVNRPVSSRCSTPTCSGLASDCSAEPTSPTLDWPVCSTAAPGIGVAWQALQELYGLYQPDAATAPWKRSTGSPIYETGEIPEFSDVVNTILAWSDEILDFHEPAAGRISNNRLEGANDKLQVLRRVAYELVN